MIPEHDEGVDLGVYELNDPTDFDGEYDYPDEDYWDYH